MTHDLNLKAAHALAKKFGMNTTSYDGNSDASNLYGFFNGIHDYTEFKDRNIHDATTQLSGLIERLTGIKAGGKIEKPAQLTRQLENAVKNIEAVTAYTNKNAKALTTVVLVPRTTLIAFSSQIKETLAQPAAQETTNTLGLDKS